MHCESNQLTSLDVSNNLALTSLYCYGNQLTSLDVSNNLALTTLHCESNQLTSLDVSHNMALTTLDCESNQLTSLDVRNGNNTNFTGFGWQNTAFSSLLNTNLTCISVDDPTWADTNWTSIDPVSLFSGNCSGLGCIDSTAYNYDPSATNNDGSCCYNAGCTDPSALNYDSVACYNDGSCTYPVYGCTDSIATNYDPTATANDGSCCYLASACYCSTSCNSFFTDVSAEHITNVTFAGINNTSGGNTGGPVDYTNLTSATVLQGNTESISVSLFLLSPYTYNEYIYVWFDWNQNGSFADTGEYYLVLGPINTVGPHIASISVPANAALGTTIMRVMVDYDNPVPDPCRNTTWGEAEDYCVTVTTSGLGCTVPSAFNYDPLATVDDGSCIYYCDISFNTPIYQDNSSNTICDGYIITNATSSYSPITYSWSNGVSGANNLNLCTGIYSVTATDAVGCSITDTFTIGQIIYGCMDALVSNYNPLANIDDGSCCIDGCTDSTAFNYNSFSDL